MKEKKKDMKEDGKSSTPIKNKEVAGKREEGRKKEETSVESQEGMDAGK